MSADYIRLALRHRFAPTSSIQSGRGSLVSWLHLPFAGVIVAEVVDVVVVVAIVLSSLPKRKPNVPLITRRRLLLVCTSAFAS